MPDPLSIASGAAGFLSLGIQVTQSLVDFYHAYKDQAGDLAKITRNLESLLNLFQTLSKALQNQKSHTDTLLQEITSLSATCSEIVDELEDECQKFQKVPKAILKERIQVAGRRLAYPFRKGTLQKLEGDISEMREMLQFALGVLQVEQQTSLETDIIELKALLDRVGSVSMLSELHSRLVAPDATVNHNTASEKRLQDTGLWFINSSSFQNWLFGRNSFLWVNGFVGSGKSVLCSTAIQQTFHHARDIKKKGIAFFYFSFAEELKQNASGMLRALLLQLSVQIEGSEERLQSLFTRYPTGIPPVRALLDCLRQLIRMFRETFILVDALDETPLGSERDLVLEMLQAMRQWDLSGFHLLVTSRDEQNIHDQLDITSKESIKMGNPGIDDDNAQFITYHLRSDHKLQKWASRHAEIQTRMMEKAHGMFRYVECQFIALRQARNNIHINQCLSSLPLDLDQTYERILCGINPIYVDDIKRFLNVLCVSKEALTVEQLLQAHAVDLTDPPHFDLDRLYTREGLLDVCRGLIELQDPEKKSPDQSQIVRIAHFSVKEYLESDRILQQNAAHFAIQKDLANSDLVQICLVALMDPCLTEDPEEIQEPKVPVEYSTLTKFAARKWFDYYQSCSQQEPRATGMVTRLFKEEPKSFKTWVELHNVDEVHDIEPITLPGEADHPQPLYYAAFLGLEDLVKSLTENSQEKGCESPGVNARGGVLNTALGAASYQGHGNIVRMLLSKGADVRVAGGLYGSALEAASRNGHESIVRLLVDEGAEVNFHGGLFGNALQAASLAGHEKIVQYLLDNGSEINSQAGIYGSAIEAAVTMGHESIVQMLVDRGANFTFEKASSGNQIDLGSLIWSPLTVQVGCNHGVMSQLVTFFGGGLQAAAFHGWEGIIEILLDQGADVNSRGGIYSTDPQIASLAGYKTMAHKLLDQDPNSIQITAQEVYDKYLDVTSRDNPGPHLPFSSLLRQHKASACHFDAGVNGLEPDTVYFNFEAATNTPQQFYGLDKQNHTGVSWSFNECDLWCGRNYGSIIAEAPCNLTLEDPEPQKVHAHCFVRVDLNYGTVIHKTAFYGDALQAPSLMGHENIVQMLLDKGADINAVGGVYGTAVEAASGNRRIRQILLTEALNRLQFNDVQSTARPLRHPIHVTSASFQSISKRGLRGSRHRRKRINARIERHVRMRTNSFWKLSSGLVNSRFTISRGTRTSY